MVNLAQRLLQLPRLNESNWRPPPDHSSNFHHPVKRSSGLVYGPIHAPNTPWLQLTPRVRVPTVPRHGSYSHWQDEHLYYWRSLTAGP